MLFSISIDCPKPLLPDVMSITILIFLIPLMILSPSLDISKSILGGRSEGAGKFKLVPDGDDGDSVVGRNISSSCGKSENKLLIKIEGGDSVVF